MEKLIDQFSRPLLPRPRRETSEFQNAVEKLRVLIRDGAFEPGDRLPSERDMISALSVRRNTLRKALDALEREGTIWRHVGKGTFLGESNAPNDFDALATLSQSMTPVRMIQARLCIEPALAREAAIHASREAITRIQLAQEAARSATRWSDYEAKDDLFHRAVAESSDNALLLVLFDQLNFIRRAVADTSVVRGSSRPARDHVSFAEHQNITDAVASHEPKAAQIAMRAHIGSVSDRLFAE